MLKAFKFIYKKAYTFYWVSLIAHKLSHVVVSILQAGAVCGLWSPWKLRAISIFLI